MADPYDYSGRDGRGNDVLWHELEDEDEERDWGMEWYDTSCELED